MTPASVLVEGRKAAGLSQRGLARRMGVQPRSVQAWEKGEYLPTVEVAARLDEALSSTRVSEAIVKARTRTCHRCERPYVLVNHSTPRSRFCSTACAHRAQRQERRERSRWTALNERDEAVAEVRDFAAILLAWCLDCEPEGLCRTPTCRWREKSPLPLERRAMEQLDEAIG